MRTAVLNVATALVVIATAGTASAQPSDKTADAAKQFVAVVGPRGEGYAPRYMAAADPTNDSRFVAAMLIPGVQLIIVAADYEVPVLLRERLLTGKFREAYLDLSTATDEKDRVMIEDIQADGLAFKPAKGVAAGDVVTRIGENIEFDGQWRKKRMKEDVYRQAFAKAESDYTRILGLLQAQAKQAQ